MAETMVMADNTTRAMDMEDASRLSLKKDIIFEGKNDKYKISIKNYIGAGGESKVYLAERISDKEKVVAKIYDTFTDDPVKKKNRKNVLNFLNENNDYKKTHIMPLLDESIIFMESSDSDDQFQRPLDIIPYCKDCELKQCDYKQLKNKVIPEILIALKTLHGSNLVHRDIKPDNIYIYNDEIVLADFGTTSQILNITDYGKTETKRGTPGYTAPEISDKYYIIESDYYSFGCTIASLYKGKHVYQTLIDQKKYVDINIAMRREGLPLSCPDTEADLQALVNALVMPDSAMRASYEGVNLWLRNPASFVNSWKDKLKQGYETVTTEFKFKDRVCKNKNDLTEAMLSDWNIAKQYLYKGGEKNSAIVNYLSKEDQNLSLKAIEIIEENRDTVKNQDLGLARFLHYFNTTDEKPCPIYWNGKIYKNLEDISKEISSNKADENSLIKMLEDKFLSWKFTNTKGIKEDTIIAIKAVEDVTASEKCRQLGYYFFMYRFASKEKKLNTSADKIFKELTDKDNWFKIEEKSVNDNKMLAVLINLGWISNVLGFKKGCTGKFNSEDSISDLLLFYQLFEGICEDTTYIREHYLHFGPQINLYRTYQKINLDSFVSKDTVKNIKRLMFNTSENINDLFNSFLSFKQYLKYEEQEKDRLEQKRIIIEKVEKQKHIASKYQNCISAGTWHTVGLRANGTVVAVGSNYDDQCNTNTWRNIIAISAATSHTVGLRANGTVVAVGKNEYGQCNTNTWRNIIAISTDYYHTVGLRANGTVVAVGYNGEGQCNTSDWRDIIAISADGSHTVGLRADGTVVAVGYNGEGQCNTSDWRDIIAISADGSHTVGLRADGTVVAVGYNDEGKCNTSDWRDIIAISASDSRTCGLRANGTVVAVGNNDNGRCNTSDWRDIIAISAELNTVGLRADGTVVAIGSKCGYDDDNTSAWRNIIAIFTDSFRTFGLKADGTVVAVGLDHSGSLVDTSTWRDIGPISEERIERMRQGLCIYCGGQMGGLFKKKCKSCGKER